MGNSYYIESGGASDTGNRWPINGNFGDPNASGFTINGRGPWYTPSNKQLYWYVPKQGVKMRILLLDTPKCRYYEWQYNCLI